MKTKAIVASLAALIILETASAQKITRLSALQLALLDSIAVQDVPKAAPGIATGIVEKGKVVYQKCSGFASLTDSTLITKDTRFNIASNGKQFTALAMLCLIEEKKLSLTDDIRKYLPALYPKLRWKITVENLLNHTSGIRDVYDLWALQSLTWWKNSFSNKDVLALIEKQEDLNFKPGARHLYSNTNYILLTAILERITGESFVAYTNKMFAKLNMPNTSFENDYTKIRGPIAAAYFNFDTWKTYNWIWNVYGDGNLFSTLADQLQWERTLQGNSNTRLKRQLIEKSQQLTAHSTIKTYGYGLEFGTYKGLDYKFHGGATGAWKATVIRFQGKHISIVTLTNTGKAVTATQTRQMADVVLNLKDDATFFITRPAAAGAFVSDDEITGIYQTENNFTFQFEKRDTALYLKRLGRNDVRLEREAANIFHQANDPDFKQEFKKNTKSEMEVTAYYTSHAPYTLTKANADWSNYNYRALNGNFLNAETNVILQITFEKGKNYDVRIGSGDSTKGLLISPTKMLVNNYVIDVGANIGIPDTLFLNADRIRKVKFVRIQ